MTFWRYHRSLPFGHVGFYWAEDTSNVHVLGGNQRDRIAIRYPKDGVIACRWPEGEDDRDGFEPDLNSSRM